MGGNSVENQYRTHDREVGLLQVCNHAWILCEHGDGSQDIERDAGHIVDQVGRAELLIARHQETGDNGLRGCRRGGYGWSEGVGGNAGWDCNADAHVHIDARMAVMNPIQLKLTSPREAIMTPATTATTAKYVSRECDLVRNRVSIPIVKAGTDDCGEKRKSEEATCAATLFQLEDVEQGGSDP